MHYRFHTLARAVSLVVAAGALVCAGLALQAQVDPAKSRPRGGATRPRTVPDGPLGGDPGPTPPSDPTASPPPSTNTATPPAGTNPGGAKPGGAPPASGPAVDTTPDDLNIPRDAQGEWTNDKSHTSIIIGINSSTNSVVLTGGEHWKGQFNGTTKITAERDPTVADVTPANAAEGLSGEEKKRAVDKAISDGNKIKLELELRVKPGSYYTLQMSGKLYPLKAEIQGQKVTIKPSDQSLDVHYTRVVRSF